MSTGLIVAGVMVASLMALFFSSLTYSLRDFSRAKLTDLLEKRGAGKYLEPTVEHASDLIFVTAVGRLLANILVLIGVLRLLYDSELPLGVQYLLAVVITAGVSPHFARGGP